MGPSCLENALRLGYTYGVVDSFRDSSKSTRPPGIGDPEIELRARSLGPRTWRNMSLRHVSLREMGWSRNPTSSGFARRIRNHRVRRRTDQSASTPSLLHRKKVLSADPHSGLSGVCPMAQVHARSC